MAWVSVIRGTFEGTAFNSKHKKIKLTDTEIKLKFWSLDLQDLLAQTSQAYEETRQDRSSAMSADINY